MEICSTGNSVVEAARAAAGRVVVGEAVATNPALAQTVTVFVLTRSAGIRNSM